MLEEGSAIELDVEKLAFGGRGLARHEGQVVFIERGLPGQRVLAAVTRVRKGFAEARAVTVLRPSPDQVEAPCPYFGRCGGCRFQDLDYAAQLYWKRQQIIESLRHVGRLADPEVAPTAPSPLVLGYRNKMEFAFAGQDHLGLHEESNPTRVLDIESCLLMPERPVKVMVAARAFCAQGRRGAYEPRTGRGIWRHLVMRVGTGQECMAHLLTSPAPEGFAPALALGRHLMAEFPELTSFVHSVRRARSAHAHGERVQAVLGRGHIEEVVGGVRLRVSPDAFVQTNTAGAALLYDLVAEGAALRGHETVWDLYSGSGGVALSLAPRAGRVIGVDSEPSAVADARISMDLNGLNNCAFVHGDVKASLASLPGPPDVVVLDPPRAGTHPGVLAALGEMLPPRIVYVSCHPVTLARDVATLLDRYRVVSATPVDLFPHTAHVECVLVLERTARGE